MSSITAKERFRANAVIMFLTGEFSLVTSILSLFINYPILSYNDVITILKKNSFTFLLYLRN